ncbi:hypothetical protein Tco_1062507, partial [Tanacetum coccineum]
SPENEVYLQSLPKCSKARAQHREIYGGPAATSNATSPVFAACARYNLRSCVPRSNFGFIVVILQQVVSRAIDACFNGTSERCDDALETLPVDLEVEIWKKLTSLYMTKSLANRMYLKKTLYKYYMSPCTKLGDHIDEFNKLILDLENIYIEIEDEDQALMLLTSLSLPSSYENFVKTLLYGRESLADVLATLISRELKKRIEGTNEETDDRVYVRRRSNHLEGHLKRDCPMKKSSRFIKKGKRDRDSDSFDGEGNAYFAEALVVVGNDEMTELVMDSGESYHMTHKRDFLYDYKGFDSGSVQLGDNRTCTIKGTWKMKIQLHDGSSFILEDVRYVPGLRKSLISLATLKKEGYTVKMQMGRIKVQNKLLSKQVASKQLVSKQVGFKPLGHKQFLFKQLGAGVETRVHGVSNDDAAVAQRRLNDKQLKEKINTDCLVKKQEKVHLGIKVGANIMVTGVPGQEGAKGNVAEKNKVMEFMKANLGKLLNYNVWSTMWSLVRGSNMRKRC